MPWWIWLIPICAIALLLHRMARRPPTLHRQVGLDRLEPHVQRLTESRGTGPVLVLERESGTGVLELTVTAEPSIQLRVPDVSWSAGRIDDAERRLSAAGFLPSWEGGSRCREVRRSLRVATRGVDDAVRAVGVTVAALGWPADTPFTVHLERG
jgi:hypothetical protein